MPKLVHLGGAKGVGKTTVSDMVNSELTKSGLKICVSHGSSLLYQMAKQSLTREWLELDETQKIEARSKAWETIKKLEYNLILLDSHYIDVNNSTHKIILPEHTWNDISHHIILEAPIDHILLRRKTDSSRERELDLASIDYEVKHERVTAEFIAAKTNAGISIIKNEDIYRAVADLCNVLTLLR